MKDKLINSLIVFSIIALISVLITMILFESSDIVIYHNVITGISIILLILILIIISVLAIIYYKERIQTFSSSKQRFFDKSKESQKNSSINIDSAKEDLIMQVEHNSISYNDSFTEFYKDNELLDIRISDKELDQLR